MNIPAFLRTRKLSALILMAGLIIAIAGTFSISKIRNTPPPSSYDHVALGTSLTAAQPSQPKITWSQPKIDITLSPGESLTKDVTFTSTVGLTNITVEAVPTIAPFVTVGPNGFVTVSANQPQVAHLAFSIAPGAALGTYDGTIHLRRGSLTLPSSLKAVINVWPTVTDNTLGLSLKYPPNLFTLPDPNKPSQRLIQSTPKELVLGGALPEDPTTPYATTGYVVAISSNVYAKPFAINQYLNDTHSSSLVDAITNTIVSGIASYKVTFREEVGAGEPIIVTPLSGKVIEIAFGSTFSPDSIEEQDALTVYDQIANSVLVIP
jgi:hypothetical protein